MTGLSQARSAVQSEISRLEARIGALKHSLELLEEGDDETLFKSRPTAKRSGTAAKTAKRSGTAAKAAKKTTAGKARKKSARGDADASLPRVGKEFWLPHFTQEYRPLPEIFNTAIQSLTPAPTSEQVRVLRSRLSAMIPSLVNGKNIKSKGAGRGRTFAVA